MHLDLYSQRSDNTESRTKPSSGLSPDSYHPTLSAMCHKCGAKQFLSMKPCKPKDLHFSTQEFDNACLVVPSGPFTDENKDWLRVLRMYNRMVTPRIDFLAFCTPFLTPPLVPSKVFEQFRETAKTPRIAHRFGLPFSVQEFLVILDEVCAYGDDLRGSNVESQYAGSKRLFLAMVDDLGFHGINITKALLTDHIPEQMEDNSILIRLLSSLEGKDFRINFRRFVQAITKPSPGRIIGPMSYFQAAMFAQSLEEVDITPSAPRLA